MYGKSLLVYLETIRQVAKIDHAQGQIQCSNTCTLFLCQNLLLLTFLVGNGSSGSFSMHFGQGPFLKYVAFFWFLHSFTGHACRINRRLLLLLLLYFNAAVFSVKSKRSYSPQRMLPFSRMFSFCWINNRQCKYLGTTPSLVKIISFKYFRESSHLKQVKRAHFRCKVLPIAAPNRMNA